MLLFLDFDGVLHPSSVFLRNGRPRLENGGGGELFMWAPLLESALEGHPVRIVISSNWPRYRGFSRARDALPEGLRRLVIGSTHHSDRDFRAWYDTATRYEQISRYLARAQVTDWLAIDDLHEGDELDDWPLAERHRLILTNPHLGISDGATAAALAEALDRRKERKR